MYALLQLWLEKRSAIKFGRLSMFLYGSHESEAFSMGITYLTGLGGVGPELHKLPGPPCSLLAAMLHIRQPALNVRDNPYGACWQIDLALMVTLALQKSSAGNLSMTAKCHNNAAVSNVAIELFPAGSLTMQVSHAHPVQVSAGRCVCCSLSEQNCTVWWGPLEPYGGFSPRWNCVPEECDFGQTYSIFWGEVDGNEQPHVQRKGMPAVCIDLRGPWP